MTPSVSRVLSDSPAARWSALLIVSFTMMAAYFLTDVMSPLEPMLEQTLRDNGLGMGWSSTEYGFFSGSYGFINVYLLMLFFGGLILDRMGIRFTGVLATSLMVIGAGIKFYAISSVSPEPTTYVNIPFLGLSQAMVKNQVLLAALGFSIFGVGAEIAGITVSKIIAKWFRGHNMALAMGLQVALARLGTALALGLSPVIAARFHSLSIPILFGWACLVIGLFAFLAYSVMDRRLDNSLKTETTSKSDDKGDDDKFRFRDLAAIFTSTGFWLITLLCLLFYSGVFPFLKFAAKLMTAKYGIDPEIAGTFPAVVPFGTILLTPVFGMIYDKIGKGATLMFIGSCILTLVHLCFALPIFQTAAFAIVLMIFLGIAFSLVPSALWPSVPKIIPMKQLGSAYAIIFYIQNIGLSMVPILIGTVLEKSKVISPTGEEATDFTHAMYIFTAFGIAAILLALALRIADSHFHYGLQQKDKA